MPKLDPGLQAQIQAEEQALLKAEQQATKEGHVPDSEAWQTRVYELTERAAPRRLAPIQKKMPKKAPEEAAPGYISSPAPLGIDVGNEVAAILNLTEAVKGGAIPNIFVRATQLVQLVEASEDDRDDNPQSLRHNLRIISPDVLRLLLTDHARPYRVKLDAEGNRSEVPSLPSVTLCKTLLTRDVWPGVPGIRSIVGTPVVRKDGSILEDPGYDVKSRLFHSPQYNMDPLPEPGTENMAKAVDSAKRLLLNQVLHDFEWVASSDKANFIAALVSQVLRPYIGGPTPLFALSATAAGAGKTLLTSLLEMFGTTWRPWVADEAELRKAITATLMEPASVIVLDNVGKGESVESATFAMLLTSKVWSDRVLGQSRNVRIPNDRLWVVTGNNIQFGGDIPSRSVLVRMRPQRSNPDLRTGFVLGNLRDWLGNPDNVARVLWSILVLVKDWMASGAPEAKITMRDYSKWASCIGGFLSHHSIPGFLENRDALKTVDIEERHWESFFFNWIQRFGIKRVTGAELVRSCQGKEDDGDWEGTFPRVRGSIPSPQALGKLLGHRKDRFFGDLVLRGSWDKHKKTNYWWVEDTSEPQQMKL